MFPAQPLRQVRLPPPSSVAAATVFASQLPPSVESLRQAIRWVTRIYRYMTQSAQHSHIYQPYNRNVLYSDMFCFLWCVCAWALGSCMPWCCANPHTSFTHPPIKVDWVHWPPLDNCPSKVRGCSQLQNYSHQGKEQCLMRHRSECHDLGVVHACRYGGHSSADVLLTMLNSLRIILMLFPSRAAELYL